MKIRNGFVSNSSSSSFCLFGITMDISDFREAVKTLPGVLFEESEEDEVDVYETLENICGENDLGFEVDWEGDESVFIGNPPGDLRDDETGKQFKERTEESIKKIFSVLPSKLSWHEGVIAS